MYLLLGVLLVLLPVGASAGSITIDLGERPITLTSTVTHDAALQRVVDRINVQINEQNAQNAAFNAANPTAPQKSIAPPLTKEEYVRSVFIGAMQSWVRDMRVENAKNACETYWTLTAAKQDAIKAELDGKSPCK